MSKKKFKLVPEMGGTVARWYGRLRSSPSQIEVWRKQASELTCGLPSGANVLEVAPGPGYLAIEIARRGQLHVTGLDISRTFVEIASENMRRQGVEVDFRQGDVAEMPFDSGTFDLIVCQAAFKNFTQPQRALDEMHRVLRPGGTAVIQDLSRDASKADIAEEVRKQQLSGLNAFITRWILSTMLRRRAYSPAQLERLAADSVFRAAVVRTEGIGIEARLKRSPDGNGNLARH